ncbi:MAG: alpha/beta fold hydrolase [Acaryochloris sp. RU_4_1]|nr:alpha/beta fold hydrolase [Acaryochloris sp. SU_5_25]NJM65294.1 alpha/beta fold hydrolase [Acaryochloris sp. RU_4_1]NJR55167.1 alpha/beta fold hydrolase [Acaryochloris sp. CRU_2_0]
MSICVLNQPQTHIWQWQGFPIYYQVAGTAGPAVVLIHGFGASSGHWRKNIAELAQDHRVYALDLIGFGRSAKPKPGSLQAGQSVPYEFETWGQQIVDFCQNVIGEAACLIGNSIGCIVALQAAVLNPKGITSVVMLNCSLRLLHTRKRASLPWYRQLSAPIFQKVLSVRPIGYFFFRRLAQPKAVRQILQQAYNNPEAVTDELVNMLIDPALDKGAADVFLAFINYSQGPLPEDLLALVTCPVLCIWGGDDPWEPVELARAFTQFPVVQDFIVLEGVGHCPQDEAPEQVNEIVKTWIANLKQILNYGA